MSSWAGLLRHKQLVVGVHFPSLKIVNTNMTGKVDHAQKAIDTNNADDKTDDITASKKSLVDNMEIGLKVVKNAPALNKESFLILSQHYNSFLSALKYLPLGTSFKDLPMEIKTQILNYLCENGAFIAASVCKEWKAILRERIVNMEKVTIGKHCQNWRRDKCFNPTEILKASLILDLNVPLLLCHEVQEVDSQLLAKALTQVSKFTLDDNCNCCSTMRFINKKALLTNQQGEDLMKALKMKTEPMKEVVLKGIDLTYLKDRLISCILKKVKTLTLIQERRGWRPYGKILNFSSFVKKLRQNSAGRKLKRLNLYFEYNGRLSAEVVADGLSTVETIDLGKDFSSNSVFYKQLILKMGTQVATKALFIGMSMNWMDWISSAELESVLLQMEKVKLKGVFSPEQVDVARNIHGGFAVQRKPPDGRVFSLGKK